MKYVMFIAMIFMMLACGKQTTDSAAVIDADVDAADTTSPIVDTVVSSVNEDASFIDEWSDEDIPADEENMSYLPQDWELEVEYDDEFGVCQEE